MRIKKEVECIFDYIERNEVSPYNVDGLSGFGWSLSYLCNKRNLNQDENELLSELDEHIFQLAKADIENNNFDFFYGGVGYGNYFIHRVKANQNIRPYLKEIGEALIIRHNFQAGKNETIDFSLSHGLSSLIVFFSNLVSLGIPSDNFNIQIENYCMRILEHTKKSRLPDVIEQGKPIYSPLRWCHGELGIVSALGFAAKTLNNKKINSEALKVANTVSLFKFDDNQNLVSANICHGTLGVAHVFQKWYNSYWKSNEIKEAAKYWYEKSIEMMNSETRYNYLDDDGVFREQTGILFGIEGMGLALISALYNKITDWDTSILLYD